MRKTFAAILLALAFGSASPAEAQKLIESYVAHLSARDHRASDGYKLSSVAEILRQDRANFHKFGKRDADDESDTFFRTASGRDAMEHLVKVGDIPRDVERAILRGTPHVVVSLYESEKNGKGYLGVVLYYP